MATLAQVGGSWAWRLAVALPIATSGCARGAMNTPDDAQALPDATEPDAGAPDAPAVMADAPVDAGCAISSGLAIMLDGIDDISKFPAAQRLSPGATLGADQVAVAWTTSHLYIAMTSSAFAAPYAPLHAYVQTGTTLAAPAAAQGKEYSSLTPALPFSPTHLVAARRVSDAVSGGYDGVFVPAGTWQTRALALDDDTFMSADEKTLSIRAPWSALGGCPTKMRLAVHVVHGQAANEWKDLVPSTHTPWQTQGGGYYEIDLTGAQAVSGWTLR